MRGSRFEGIFNINTSLVDKEDFFIDGAFSGLWKRKRKEGSTTREMLSMLESTTHGATSKLSRYLDRKTGYSSSEAPTFGRLHLFERTLPHTSI
jgi:hypothetical protein